MDEYIYLHDIEGWTLGDPEALRRAADRAGSRYWEWGLAAGAGAWIVFPPRPRNLHPWELARLAAAAYDQELWAGWKAERYGGKTRN